MTDDIYFTDRFGNEIRPGATVVYATRRSSSLYVHVAVVREIVLVPKRWSRDSGVALKVTSLQDRWGEKRARDVTLTALSHVMKYDRQLLSAEARAILDAGDPDAKQRQLDKEKNR